LAETAEITKGTARAEVSAQAEWPKISLVTPVWNSAKYIEQTIHSVLSQEYPNLEYFVIDGGSTDGTLDTIRKYEKQISGWISEPDKGMYDALNKGFARTTGEIMGWISATDKLHTGGLSVVGSVFRDLPEVEWITGRATAFNDEGMTVTVLDIPHWSRYRFLAGANQFIQQESTFWRRSLWERAGARMDSSHRNGADFELWVRFFRHAQLYPVEALIGGFRCHPDSLGLQNMLGCQQLHAEFVEAELGRIPWPIWLKLYRLANRIVAPIPRVRTWWRSLTKYWLYRAPGADWPPVIEYGNNRWRLREKSSE